MVTLALFCSSPFPGSSRPVEPSLNSPQKTWRCSTIFPNITSQLFALLTLPAKQSGLYTHCLQTSPASTVSTQPVPLLLPQVHALFSLPKPLLLSPSPLSIPPPLWHCSSISPAGVGSPPLKSYSVLDKEFTLCLALFVIMWTDMLIQMHLFFIREYSLFIARYYVFGVLESRSKGSRLCLAHKRYSIHFTKWAF